MIKYPLVLGLLVVSSLQGMDEEKKTNRTKSLMDKVRSLKLQIPRGNNRSREFRPLSENPASPTDSRSAQASSSNSMDIGSPTGGPSSGQNSSARVVTSPRLMPVKSPRNSTPQSQSRRNILVRFKDIDALDVNGAFGATITYANEVYDPECPHEVVVVEDALVSPFDRTHFSNSLEGRTGKLYYSTEDLSRDIKLKIYLGNNPDLKVLYENEPAATSPRRQQRGIGFSLADDPSSPTL